MTQEIIQIELSSERLQQILGITQKILYIEKEPHSIIIYFKHGNYELENLNRSIPERPCLECGESFKPQAKSLMESIHHLMTANICYDCWKKKPDPINVANKNRAKARKLYPHFGKVIHHIDMDTSNNEPENIHIFNTRKEHALYHVLLSNLVKQELSNLGLYNKGKFQKEVTE